MTDFSFDRPPEDIIRCLVRLQSNSDFIDVIEWFKDGMIAEAIKATKNPDAWERIISSGKVQMVETILKLGEQAKQTLEALQKQNLEGIKAGSL